MRASTIYAIMKIGPEKFMHEFRSQGRLYMNTLRYFKTLEAKDHLRADKSEGLSASYPAKKVKLLIGDRVIRDLIRQVRVDHNEDDRIAIFCLYAITNANIDEIVNDRVLEFGDTTVVITEGREFRESIVAECKQRRWPCECALVEYIDKDTHEGDMGPFRKYSERSFQSEYRIAIRPGRNGAVEDFYLGDLSDITVICKTSEVKSLIKRDA